MYDRFTNLKEHPKRFQVDDARTLNKGYEIRRLNYGEFGVFYRAYDERSLVEILDLRHGYRLPKDAGE